MKSIKKLTGNLILVTLSSVIMYAQANAAFPHTPSGQLKNIFVPLQEREKAVVNEQTTVSVEKLKRHFLLYGIISGPKGQTALLKINPKESGDLPADLKDKPYIVLKKGEKLEDFTLTDLTSKSVVFKRGDKIVQFQLFEDDDRPERSKSPVAQATPQVSPPPVATQMPGIVQPPVQAGAPTPIMAQNMGPTPPTPPPSSPAQPQPAQPQLPKAEGAKPTSGSSTPDAQFGPAPIQPPQGGDLPHASAAPPPTADNPFLKALERARANQGSAPAGGAANPFMNLMKSN